MSCENIWENCLTLLPPETLLTLKQLLSASAHSYLNVSIKGFKFFKYFLVLKQHIQLGPTSSFNSWTPPWIPGVYLKSPLKDWKVFLFSTHFRVSLKLWHRRQTLAAAAFISNRKLNLLLFFNVCESLNVFFPPWHTSLSDFSSQR